jgi:hypothetical protein
MAKAGALTKPGSGNLASRPVSQEVDRKPKHQFPGREERHSRVEDRKSGAHLRVPVVRRRLNSLRKTLHSGWPSIIIFAQCPIPYFAPASCRTAAGDGTTEPHLSACCAVGPIIASLAVCRAAGSAAEHLDVDGEGVKRRGGDCVAHSSVDNNHRRRNRQSGMT